MLTEVIVNQEDQEVEREFFEELRPNIPKEFLPLFEARGGNFLYSPTHKPNIPNFDLTKLNRFFINDRFIGVSDSTSLVWLEKVDNLFRVIGSRIITFISEEFNITFTTELIIGKIKPKIVYKDNKSFWDSEIYSAISFHVEKDRNYKTINIRRNMLSPKKLGEYLATSLTISLEYLMEMREDEMIEKTDGKTFTANFKLPEENVQEYSGFSLREAGQKYSDLKSFITRQIDRTGR